MSVKDLLPEYVLGALSDEETKAFEAELARSPEWLAEIAAAEASFGLLAQSLPTVAPPAAVKARLFKTLESGDRYLPFADDIAKYCDLAADKIRELFKLIDGVWEQGPMPGIELIHFDGGPGALAPDLGFVRLPAGLHFPMHKHHGPEVNYVLEGSMIDGDGTVYGPGEAIEKDIEDQHEFKIPDDRDTLIFVAQSGFEIIFPE